MLYISCYLGCGNVAITQIAMYGRQFKNKWNHVKRFMETIGIKAEKLTMVDITKIRTVSFLDWLETTDNFKNKYD